MRNRRKTAGKKGFSSVVGAVFMVLIMMVLASSYFVYSLSQNNVYNNAVAQKNQLNVDRLSESAQVINTTYTPYANGSVTVYAQIKNIGASSFQFITVWLYVSNATWTNYNFSKLSNANVPSGNLFTLPNVSLKISGISPNATYTFASWLITARGNVVPLQQTIVFANNIIVAQVAQGIGSISMDMKQFTHYDLDSSPNNGTDIGAPNHSFIVPKLKYTFFALLLTNCDPSGQNINLTSNCYIWVPTAQSETMKSDSWSIAKIVGNKYMTGFTYQILPWSIPTWVYFGATQPKWDVGVLPVNICLFGKIGSADYGQNIPFVSVNFQ